jgi:HEPN domain-containing protein
MRENERILVTVREWVEKAEGDLENARLVLRAGRRCPSETVCFHAQQCAEKYLKAYLTFRSLEFPKTHSIQNLLSLMPARERPNLTIREQARLSEYAIGPRYPGWSDVSLSEARQAVALARQVRKHVRSFLPREALRRRNR